MNDSKMIWQPIATAPRDGTYILLAGPSGYVTTPLRVEVGRYEAAYNQPWITHSNDSFTDGGELPIYWLPLPEIPPVPPAPNKLCPFCGGTPELTWDRDNPNELGLYWIECADCSAKPKRGERTPEEAWAKWNKRIKKGTQ